MCVQKNADIYSDESLPMVSQFPIFFGGGGGGALCNQCLSPLKVVSSNPVHDEVYLIQHLCDEVCQ